MVVCWEKKAGAGADADTDETGVESSAAHSDKQDAAALLPTSEDREEFSVGDLLTCSPEAKFVLAVSLVAALNSIMLGYDISIMSAANVFIRKQLLLTDEQEELESGMLNATGLPGALLCGWAMDRYGRKASLLGTCWVAGIGSAMTALSAGISMLVLGRAVLGVGIGGIFTVVPVYIAELVPMHMRGFLVSLCEVSISVGVFLGFLVGCAFESVSTPDKWRIMVGLPVIPACILTICIRMLPETPRWLAFNDRESEAISVIRRTCASDSAAEVFMREIEESKHMAEGDSWRHISSPTRTLRLIWTVGLGAAVMQQLTGVEATMYYTPVMLNNAGLTSEKTQLFLTLLLGVLKLVVTVVASTLVDKLGRRPLLISGSLCIACCYVVMSISYITGCAVTCVIGLYAFICSYAFSLGPVVWVTIAEVFPTKVRGPAASIATGINRATSAACTFCFLSISRALTPAGLFALLAVVNLGSMCFFYLLLPESKGKTLEEIEQEFAFLAGESVDQPSHTPKQPQLACSLTSFP